MNGKFKQWKDAKIHLITHTLHYSGGAFEGIRFYNTPDGPAVFRLKDHIKRFFYSSKAIGIKIPYSQKALFSRCFPSDSLVVPVLCLTILYVRHHPPQQAVPCSVVQRRR